MNQVALQSKQFHETYGYWPTGFESFFPAGNPDRLMFLVPAATNDGWHHAMLYYPFNAAIGYGRVVSLGRDGKFGGSGVDKDMELRFTTNQ